MSDTLNAFDQLAASVDAARDLVDALDDIDQLDDIDDLTDEARGVLSDHGIEEIDDRDPAELFDDLIENAALEIYGNARLDHHGIDLSGIVVVTGIGGPHVEFEVSHTGGVEIRGYWGSDRVTRWTRAAFGDRLAEAIGGWEQDR